MQNNGSKEQNRRLVRPILDTPRVISGFMHHVVPQINHTKSPAKEAVSRLREKHEQRKAEAIHFKHSLERVTQYSQQQAS